MARPPAAAPQARTAPAADLAHPFGRKPLRTFSYLVALPALLIYVASVGLVILVLVLMGKDIGRLEDARDVSVMHAALGSFLNDLSGQVADEGTWDEAYLNVVVNSDAAWMDGTWGASARLGQSYDNVLVTDADGTIVFGENAVGPISGNIGIVIPAARTMLHDLDRGIAATGDATTVSDFAADKAGAMGLAAMSIHPSTGTNLSVPRQNRRILWLALHIGPAVMQDIASRYQTPVAALVDSPGDAQLSLPLPDTDGSFVGAIAWDPQRASDSAFSRALLIATGVFFAIGAILLAGLRLLRRAIVQRAALAETGFAAIEREALIEIATAAAGMPVAAQVAPVALFTPVAPGDTGPSPIEGVSPGDFDIEYQPIFDLRAETLIGAEALLRWRKRDKSLVLQESLSPAEVITLLEKVGLLAIRRAADDVAPLLGLQLTLAITPAQLLNSIFAEKLRGTLAATSFPARRLQLFINTEALRPPGEIRAALAELRQSGIAVGFSDYLIGPSTIAYAEPDFADRIRLPTATIAGIDADAPRTALVEATLNIAKSAGLTVTVAGVSRKQEAARLLRLGCREFQGAVFAPPMPIAALTQLVLRPATRQAS